MIRNRPPGLLPLPLRALVLLARPARLPLRLRLAIGLRALHLDVVRAADAVGRHVALHAVLVHQVDGVGRVRGFGIRPPPRVFGDRVQLVVAPPVVRVLRGGAVVGGGLAGDEEEDGAEGGEAGGDDDDVAFHAVGGCQFVFEFGGDVCW